VGGEIDREREGGWRKRGEEIKSRIESERMWGKKGKRRREGRRESGGEREKDREGKGG
jgi:hypothetical protein